MPAKVTIWDKQTPQHILVKLNPDWSVQAIETQYVMEDSADPRQRRTENPQADAAVFALAAALVNRLRANALAAEGL